MQLSAMLFNNLIISKKNCKSGPYLSALGSLLFSYQVALLLLIGMAIFGHFFKQIQDCFFFPVFNMSTHSSALTGVLVSNVNRAPLSRLSTIVSYKPYCTNCPRKKRALILKCIF
ncbi:hypothetical protein F5Y11DRAFT_22021 [Daldinia sp. FL1419]|nr:hypothetical protein F5Y11DRAFT_22021 [Daldinia sp. FL1419]